MSEPRGEDGNERLIEARRSQLDQKLARLTSSEVNKSVEQLVEIVDHLKQSTTKYLDVVGSLVTVDAYAGADAFHSVDKASLRVLVSQLIDRETHHLSRFLNSLKQLPNPSEKAQSAIHAFEPLVLALLGLQTYLDQTLGTVDESYDVVDQRMLTVAKRNSKDFHDVLFAGKPVGEIDTVRSSALYATIGNLRMSWLDYQQTRMENTVNLNASHEPLQAINSALEGIMLKIRNIPNTEDARERASSYVQLFADKKTPEAPNTLAPEAQRTKNIAKLTEEEQELLRQIVTSQNSEASQRVDEQIRHAILMISKYTQADIDNGASEPPTYLALDQQIRTESIRSGNEYGLGEVLSKRLDEIKAGALAPLEKHQQGGSARVFLIHDAITRGEHYGGGSGESVGLLPWQTATALVFSSDISSVEPIAAINPTETLPSVTGSDKTKCYGVVNKFISESELGKLHDVGLKITLASGVEYQLFYNAFFDVNDKENYMFAEFALVSNGKIIARDRIPDKSDDTRPKQSILFVQ